MPYTYSSDDTKKIAEFMGLAKQLHLYEHPITGDYVGTEYLDYCVSWDWLMLVVEKIESMSYRKGRQYFLKMEQGSVGFEIDRMNIKPFSKWGTQSNNDKFYAVLRAVLEFIDKHNAL